MIDALYKALEHAPALAAMVIIVLFFLRAQKEILESHAKRTTEFIDTVKGLNSDSVRTQERSISLVEKNIQSQSENTMATKELTHAMKSTCKFVGK